MIEIFRIFDRAVVALGSLVILGLCVSLGFDLNQLTRDIIFYYIVTVSFVFVCREAYRFHKIKDKKRYLLSDWYDILLIFLMWTSGLYCFFSSQIQDFRFFITWSWGVLSVLGLFSALVDRVESKVVSSRIKLRPSQLFIMSFIFPIVMGTCLLMMPNSSHLDLKWVDAFFMATSAVSVTGLAVFDLNQLTFLGQVVMLVMIQLGGIGMMTLTFAFTGLIAGGLGVKERLLLGDMLSEDRLSEIKSLLLKICLFTFLIEAIGVFYLYSVRRSFDEVFSLKVFWESIFYSVSAFCNAGFSLEPEGMMSKKYALNQPFLSGIMILIVLGGLGFPSLSNLQRVILSYFRKSAEYKILSTNTKMIIATTIFLLISGAVLFFFTESQNLFLDMSTFDRFFNSLFLSVTARTAGFNLIQIDQLSVTTLFVLILLMAIGGAPMSTAGGIKVTTFLVGILNVWSHVKGESRLEIFGKSIRSASILKAYAVVISSLVFIFIGTILIVWLEPDKNPLDLLFEVVSAVSTVGLSRSLTPYIQDESKMLLAFLMLIGRVGVFTFLTAIIRPSPVKRYKLLDDDIIIH